MKIKGKIESIKEWIKSYKIQLMIIFLIVIGGCFTIGWFFNYSLTKVFNQAIIYYQENDLLEFETIRYELYSKHGQAFDEFLTEQALETFEKYKNEEISYYEAIGIAKRIEAFSNKSSNIQSFEEQIEQLRQSRKVFERAETAAINKQWEEAYDLYQQVVEWDPNYEKAQQLVESSKRWWLQDILVEALTQYEEGAYEQALLTVEKGLELSPENETFTNLQESIQLAMTEGEKEDKWTEFKNKITSSIQSGIESIQDIFNKIFKR